MVAVYEQCGLRIRSEIELDLPVAAGDGWDLDVRWGPDIHDSAAPPPGEVIAEYVTSDSAWYRLTESATGYLLRFRDCGEFVISPDLSDVTVRRDPAGRHELLPILLAGTASAVLLTLRGATVLHASAVSVDGTGLAFVGQSGRGKSTVAALMCLGGAALVTDDVLTVDPGPPVQCQGGASELRLREAAAHLADAHPDRSHTTADDRRAFAPAAAPPGPLPLAAIVVPSPSRTASAIDVVRIPPSDAMFLVMTFPRVHGWKRSDVLTREFTTLSKLVNGIPVYDVTIPWGPPFSDDIAPQLAALAAS
jgi:hypothetical protein